MKIHSYIFACIAWIALVGGSNCLQAQTAAPSPRVITAADQQQMLAAKEAYLKAHPAERAKAEASMVTSTPNAAASKGEPNTNPWGIGESYDAQKKLDLFQSGKLAVETPGGVHAVDRTEYVTMPKERQDAIKANPNLYKLEDTKRGL